VPNSFIGVYKGDLDNACEQLQDWQETFKWDYTREQYLFLSSTQVSNLKSLSNLTNLRGLNLSSTPINDLEPLSGLLKLQKLNLSDTRISNIMPLSELTNLHELVLKGTNVSNEQIKELKKVLPELNVL
jgi:Leucine-rich repeat (LRR) protein